MCFIVIKLRTVISRSMTAGIQRAYGELGLYSSAIKIKNR